MCVEGAGNPAQEKEAFIGGSISEGGHGQEMVLQNGDLLCFKKITPQLQKRECLYKEKRGTEIS